MGALVSVLWFSRGPACRALPCTFALYLEPQTAGAWLALPPAPHLSDRLSYRLAFSSASLPPSWSRRFRTSPPPALIMLLPLLRSSAPLVSRGIVTAPRCVATVATIAASPIFEAGATALGLAVAALLLLGVVPLSCWLAYEMYVLDLRKQRSGTGSAKSRGVEPGSSAYVRPRQVWRLDELPAYDGSGSEDGPILLAADGQVFNVARARHLYGPGGEYGVMGGADASRYLARNSVDPETPEEEALPLSLVERTSLGAWVFSLQQKYDVVGRLASDAEAAKAEANEQRREASAAVPCAVHSPHLTPTHESLTLRPRPHPRRTSTAWMRSAPS